MLEDHKIVYGGNQATEPLFSRFMSNAEQLPEGYLILEGSRGRIFTINDDNEVTWQLNSRFYLDDVFRAYSYPLDFVGFEDRDLSPKSTQFFADNFEICTELSSTDEIAKSYNITPNPFTEYIDIELTEKSQVLLHSSDQVLMQTKLLGAGSNRINLEALSAGFYFLTIENETGLVTEKIVKL